MSSSVHAQHGQRAFSTSSHWIALVSDALVRLAKSRQRQHTIAALKRLSDHQLRDIGLTRGEIAEAVAQGIFDL